MKWLRRGLLTLIVGAGLTVAGVAWLRPDLVASRIRWDLERLPDWAHPWDSTSEEQDEKQDDETEKASEAEHGRESLQVVRLASARMARRFGVETAPVRKEQHAHHLVCNAETAYDARHSAEILARVPGVLREVRADLGQVVCKADLLAVVDSAQIGTSKVQYHAARAAVELAQVTYDRTVRLTKEKATPAKNELESLTALSQAKASLMDTKQKLRNLGFSDAEIARIAKDSDASNRLEIVAPIGGTITAWDATPGEAVEPTTQLFAMADTTAMWLWIDVYESEIASVAVGQPVTFTISGTETPVFSGRVTSVGTEVNPTTRTTRVRAELRNPDGRLRANQFGRAKVQVEPEHEAVVIPRAAVQSDGKVEMVFLPIDDHSYRALFVTTRPTERDDVVEVVKGLESGQQVVTTRSYMLKAELFKNRLGAADND
jgi:cobalt-zinc-cadmium efflux system membrane fusion protein